MSRHIASLSFVAVAGIMKRQGRVAHAVLDSREAQFVPQQVKLLLERSQTRRNVFR